MSYSRREKLVLFACFVVFAFIAISSKFKIPDLKTPEGAWAARLSDRQGDHSR